MTKQIFALLITVFSITSGATIQSPDNVSRNYKSTICPDTMIQIKYYQNGFPKYARETAKPGITRTTEWYPDGVMKLRTLNSSHCSTPFYTEEWYENGIKKKKSTALYTCVTMTVPFSGLSTKTVLPYMCSRMKN